MPESSSPIILRPNDTGQDVIHLQAALAREGALAGRIDGSFGTATRVALQTFQSSAGLACSGMLDAITAQHLGWTAWKPTPAKISGITASSVAPVFEATKFTNVEANLPEVLNAMLDAGLGDPPMIAMALATIRTETSQFLPVSEGVSVLNTSAGGKPFDLYDNRKALGNGGEPDGAFFCGRGFIQLTGRANYAQCGEVAGYGSELCRDPYRVHRSDVAARLLAVFLKAKAPRIRHALAIGDFADARRAVNGGGNGLPTFIAAWKALRAILPDVIRPAA